MVLISDTISMALEDIMGMQFQTNRLLDRMSTQLAVKFLMPNTSEIVHKKMAHQFPLIADKVSEYCESRNYGVGYPETTSDFTEYANLNELFTAMLDYFIEIENSIIKCIQLTINEQDKMTEIFLNGFLFEIKHYTEMALNFVDYVEKNGDDSVRHMSMDARISKFLGIDLETED